VSRQGAYAAVITHHPEIPRAMLPVIVTDASARHGDSVLGEVSMDTRMLRRTRGGHS